MKSVKECVTTHLPNGPAPKMDGAGACDRFSIIVVTRCSNEKEGMGVCYEALGVSRCKTASGADLGGSSKYSNENFEDRSGEGRHVNSSLTWISRSLKIGVFRTRGLGLVS